MMAADCAPKSMSFSAVVHGQNRGFRWRGWSENDQGELRIKIQVVVWPNSGGIDDDENGWSCDSFKLNRRCFGHFPTTRMAGVWWPASKLQISTLLDWCGVQKSEIRLGDVHELGRVGFAGQNRVNFLSLSLSLSLFLSLSLSLSSSSSIYRTSSFFKLNTN